MLKYIWHHYALGSVQNTFSIWNHWILSNPMRQVLLLSSFYSWGNREERELLHCLMAWERIKTQTVCLWRPCSKQHLALPGFSVTEDLPHQPWAACLCTSFMWERNKPQACLSPCYFRLSIVSCQAYASLIHTPNWFSCLQALVQSVPSAWNALSLVHATVSAPLMQNSITVPCLPVCLPSQRVTFQSVGTLSYYICTHKT